MLGGPVLLPVPGIPVGGVSLGIPLGILLAQLPAALQVGRVVLVQDPILGRDATAALPASPAAGMSREG